MTYEDVVGSASGRSTAVGGDVADARDGRQDAEVTVLEPACGVLAENEVGGTLDQAVGVDLVTGLRQDGVLVASELASVVTRGCVSRQRNGLRSLTVTIFYVSQEFLPNSDAKRKEESHTCWQR